MSKEYINLIGTIKARLYNEKGDLIDSQDVKNMVVTVGQTFIFSRMKDATATVMSHMAIGSGNTAPVLGNTTMQTQLARVALTSTTANPTNITYTATFPAGTGTGTITECGLFNASTGGTMLSRSASLNINKTAGSTLTLVWEISLTNL